MLNLEFQVVVNNETILKQWLDYLIQSLNITFYLK